MIVRVLAVVMLVACGANTTPSPPRIFGGDRPVDLQVPPVLQARRKFPLLVILHDYGSTGVDQQALFGMTDEANNDNAFVLAPDGMTDSMAKQFWNADATCCDFEHKNPDDVGYLGTLIEQVRTVWPIDPNKVAVIGYAGGGTMAYRLACERADLVSNVVVLAGPVASTPCAPARSVNVLHVHGTADATVPYSIAGPSVQQWAVNDHCGSSRALGASVDIDGSLAGNETVTESVVGCPAGVRVDLWTIEGGSHTPSLVPTFDPIARQWIIEHPRM